MESITTSTPRVSSEILYGRPHAYRPLLFYLLILRNNYYFHVRVIARYAFNQWRIQG